MCFQLECNAISLPQLGDNDKILREADTLTFEERKNDALDQTIRKLYYAPYFEKKGHNDQSKNKFFDTE